MVEAAARIVERDGYDAANVNEIARVAGVSTGSLYQYFPTKEALVGAVAQRQSNEMIAVFVRELEALPLEPFDQAVQAIVRASLIAFRFRPRLRRVILEQVPEVSRMLTATEDFDDRLRYLIVAYMEQHAATFRPADLDLAAQVLMVSVEAVAGRLSSDPRIDQDRLVEELCVLVTRYLLR
jgi:AcrR family transcriptional regulator